MTSWCFSSSSSLLSVIGLPQILLSQQLPLGFLLLVVWFLIIAWAIHGPWPMSGPGLVGCMDLTDCSPPVEVNSAQEHGSLVLLVADEALFLPAKIFVPRPELGAGGAEAC